MPTWNQVLTELQNETQNKNPIALDTVRRKYLALLQSHTKRNIIAYYSGWFKHPDLLQGSITDEDKNGFMSTIHGLDCSLGLDLLLHTPGGDIAATESLVNYLRKKFQTNIRVIVPQLAMSAGTMIACASKEIIMGKQSNLGPIDPQFRGIPAHGVLEEFKTALKEITKDKNKIPLWQVIVGKYHPTFLGECKHAIDWSKQIVTDWLRTGMFLDDNHGSVKAKKITSELSNHKRMKTHARHIHMEECKRLGLKVLELESDPILQDLVLTVHHCFMHTFANSIAIKIIENHMGIAYMNLNAPPPPQQS